MYLLDTNIVSYLFRNNSKKLDAEFKKKPAKSCYLSVVTLAELLFGAEKSSKPEYYKALISEFISVVKVLEWSREAAVEYAIIRRNLELSGRVIGGMDMMIAAHAIADGKILITNNVREFSRIAELKFENWV